ncbi:MAG: hypothetical protein ACRCZ0_08870 [Cetobacterium sp.]
MFVDITELVRDSGVGEYVTITLLADPSNTGDFGVPDNSKAEVIEDVFVTMVEDIDDVVDSQSGSYISRVAYRFYIPASICLEYDLCGATISTSGERNFTVTNNIIRRKYVSHCVVNATEDKGWK